MSQAEDPNNHLSRLLDRLFPSTGPVSPQDFLNERHRPPGQVVVLFGDSLTEGRISHSFAAGLQDELGPHGYHFINAGISADLAYNLLKRVDEVIACRPDQVMVLVGTNDVLGTASRQAARRYMRLKALPQAPSDEWFAHNLAEILQRLKASLPNPRIAVLTLGMLGEDLFSAANRRTAAYSLRICEIAASAGVDCLPLHERFTESLQQRAGSHRLRSLDIAGWEPVYLMYKAALQRILLRWSYTRIGSSNGFYLLSDGVHFNQRGAALVQDLAREWLLLEKTAGPSPQASWSQAR